jgi:hypothetical protein
MTAASCTLGSILGFESVCPTHRQRQILVFIAHSHHVDVGGVVLSFHHATIIRIQSSTSLGGKDNHAGDIVSSLQRRLDEETSRRRLRETDYGQYGAYL